MIFRPPALDIGRADARRHAGHKQRHNEFKLGEFACRFIEPARKFSETLSAAILVSKAWRSALQRLRDQFVFVGSIQQAERLAGLDSAHTDAVRWLYVNAFESSLLRSFVNRLPRLETYVSSDGSATLELPTSVRSAVLEDADDLARLLRDVQKLEQLFCPFTGLVTVTEELALALSSNLRCCELEESHELVYRALAAGTHLRYAALDAELWKAARSGDDPTGFASVRELTLLGVSASNPWAEPAPDPILPRLPPSVERLTIELAAETWRYTYNGLDDYWSDNSTDSDEVDYDLMFEDMGRCVKAISTELGTLSASSRLSSIKIVVPGEATENCTNKAHTHKFSMHAVRKVRRPIRKLCKVGKERNVAITYRLLPP